MANKADDEFFRNREIVEARKKEAESRFKRQSKERLKKNITSRMKTTMIGSLAIFEKYLGYLWGHEAGKTLSPEQKELRSLWEEIRAEILDLGNGNIRAIEDELLHYNCEWQRYNTNIRVDNEYKREVAEIRINKDIRKNENE